MRRLMLAVTLAVSGCATMKPSPGGHETMACQAHVDDRAPSFTVYVCPRPFPSQQRALKGQNCSGEAWAWRSASGPTIPCGWTAGFTDLRAKEIYVYDVFMPEALDHEILHATGRIADDQ